VFTFISRTYIQPLIFSHFSLVQGERQGCEDVFPCPCFPASITQTKCTELACTFPPFNMHTNNQQHLNVIHNNNYSEYTPDSRKNLNKLTN